MCTSPLQARPSCRETARASAPTDCARPTCDEYGRLTGHTDHVECLGSNQVYANPWMVVREDEVRHLDGSTGIYAVVEAPDIALIIPIVVDRLHLVEQYRYPVAGRRWEFPSGTTDPVLDGDPSALAERELREETGLAAGRLARLGTLDTMPSTLNQQCAVFLATDLSHHTPQREHEEQDMQSSWFTRGDVERMINDGAITDAKSIAAYALLLIREMSS